MCSYGMPSECRGWLAFVREKAEQWITRSVGVHDAAIEKTRLLARQLMMLTGAVHASMVYGSETLPYTTAVALAEMRRIHGYKSSAG